MVHHRVNVSEEWLPLVEAAGGAVALAEELATEYNQWYKITRGQSEPTPAFRRLTEELARRYNVPNPLPPIPASEREELELLEWTGANIKKGHRPRTSLEALAMTFTAERLDTLANRDDLTENQMLTVMTMIEMS